MKRILPYAYKIFFSILVLIPIVQIFFRSVNLVGLACWLGSITLLIYSTYKGHFKYSFKKIQKNEITIVFLLLLMHGASLWIAQSDINHFHRDEFVLSYTSYEIPRLSEIDWFKGYPEDWVGQSPILFHILQKPFFFLFGANVSAMKVSVWPYCFGILIYLYLIFRRKFNAIESASGIVLYIFTAIILYFYSFSLHHISSAFFILAVLFHCTLLQEHDHKIHEILTAIYLACSLLTYTGSYISIFIPITFAVLHIRQQTFHRVKRKLINVLVIFSIIMLPFISHAIIVHNYFMDRYHAINIYNGYWTNSQELRENNVSTLTIVIGSTIATLRSFIVPGIGGFGGYYFGFQALFPIFNFCFFILGIYSVSNIKSKSDPLLPYLSILVFFAFLFGPALTVQPPGIHRLSPVFPIFSLLTTYGLIYFAKAVSNRHRKIEQIVFFISCIVFFVSNTNHYLNMLRYDIQDYPYTPDLTRSIVNNTHPYSTIPIASYFGFHMHKELLFRTRNMYTFYNSTPEDILSSYTGGPIIIVNPQQDTIDTLVQEYPNHTLEYYGFEDYPPRILSEPSIFFYPTVPANPDDSAIIPQ